MTNPKRMIEFKRDPKGKLQVFINSSSVDIFLACPRKAQYRLMMGLVKEGTDDSDARALGRAIHAAMESWYGKNGKAGDDTAALHAFVQNAGPLAALDPTDVRSIPFGQKTLSRYFDNYRTDQFKVLKDEKGLPIVERSFELPLFMSDSIDIYYHGTIDCMWSNPIDGLHYVVDHKTSRTLGQEFINKGKPNHQFSGYIWAAQKLGWNPAGFIVNGIQIAKTKTDMMRIISYRTTEELEEWKLNVISVVQNILSSARLGFFIQNAPATCVDWGGCSYRDLCEAPVKDRLKIIGAKYPEAMKNGVPGMENL